MYSFESDYITGAHPEILKKLIETNEEVLSGYGADRYTESAAEKIKAACGREDAEVEFIAGGTQTNAVVIASLLRDWEGAVSATTGHINAHEAGAVEYTRNKINELPGVNGKLPADTLRKYLENFYNDANHEHMVFPGLVYISHPTEYGTLYTKAELTELHEICESYHIPLFLDGARLAYALTSPYTDVTLQDIARLTDVFYIGGTKCGALIGEAVVFTHGNRPPHFLNSVKKRGALLAKGRLIGIQFDTLFTDGLYEKIGHHANALAQELIQIFNDENIPFFLDSPTNQQFVIMENTALEELKNHCRYGFWETYDETHTVVRFATTWSTKEEDLQVLKEALRLIRQ